MSIRAGQHLGCAPLPLAAFRAMYIQNSNLYKLTANIFVDDFLQDLPGLLSKSKVRFLYSFSFFFFFSNANLHNKILKFHPSPKIYTVFCVDEDQIWLKIILMENVQLSLQQDKALTEPCHAEVLA